MWHLEPPLANKLDEYVTWLISLIKKRINTHRTNPNETAWCNYLLPQRGVGLYDESIIAEILIAKPARLFKLNNQHLNQLLRLRQATNHPGGFRYTYSEHQLRHYIKAKSKRNRSPRERSLVERYERLFEFLLAIFDYDIINGKIAYDISMMNSRNTCTYCNRQYTFTIGRKHTNKKTVSKIKPQFDHWFAHKQYPLLSLSFYNLIPSCSVCNSSVKGDAHYSLKTHIHPYMTNTSDPAFQFRPILINDPKTNKIRWSVLLQRRKLSKEDNTINALSLDQVYDQHGSLEVKDIMDFALKNNTTYLKTLFVEVCADLHADYSQAEVYRMLFGIEFDIDKTLNRPLSKLKRDILEGEEIKVS